MGSLSHFIIEPSVRIPLDEAFDMIIESQVWEDYFDDCHLYLNKASQVKAKLSFSGALTVIQYYYDNVIKTTDDENTVCKGVRMLEQISSLCSAYESTEESSDWLALLVASDQMHDCIIPALQHEQEPIQHFAMKQIAKCIKSSAGSALIKLEGLLVAVLRTLGSGVNQVSTLAKKVLVDVCRSDEGLAAVFMDGAKLDIMTEVAALSDTAKFNVYELVQQVCVLGADQLSVVSNSGWLDQLVAEATSHDTLAQLAALQLVSDLVVDERSLQHLCTAGVLHKLQRTLFNGHSDRDTMAAMNIPGLLKVFGAAGRTRPELVSGEHSEVVLLMLRYSGGGDQCLSLIALETLATLAATHRAKTALQYSFKIPLQKCLKAVGEKLHSAPMENRVRILAALVHLLNVLDAPSEGAESDEVSEVLHSWYGAVFPCENFAPVDILMRLPFPDLHFEVYRLMLALLKHTWGAQLIADSDETLQYLLDRRTETCFEGRELKFKVVAALVRHSQVLEDTAGQRTADLLLEYYKKGPVYVPPYDEATLQRMMNR